MTEQSTETARTWSSMRVLLAPGNLLVSREGPAIVVADTRTPGQEATADRLLDLCGAHAAAATTGTGAALVRAAAALLTVADADEVPALALVTVDADRLLLLLTPGLRAAVTDGSGVVDVIGADDALLPVSRVLGSAARVALGLDPEALDADRRSNLSGGVVRAGGLVLVPGSLPAADERAEETLVGLEPPAEPAVAAPAPPEPEQPEQPEQPGAPLTFETFPLYEESPAPAGVATAEAAEAPAPAPVGPLPSEPMPVDEVPDGPLVRGIVCSRGHFNPPDGRFCQTCGISMVHQTHNVVTGVRPPLGVLVADDGAVHALVGDLVVGRDPGTADEVHAGHAGALVLDDPDLSLSRVHARLVLDGWEVRVEDAGSVNGTYVADAGSEEWRRLEPQLPTTIVPGTRLRMGSRVLTFESHHKL